MFLPTERERLVIRHLQRETLGVKGLAREILWVCGSESAFSLGV